MGFPDTTLPISCRRRMCRSNEVLVSSPSQAVSSEKAESAAPFAYRVDAISDVRAARGVFSGRDTRKTAPHSVHRTHYFIERVRTAHYFQLRARN